MKSETETIPLPSKSEIWVQPSIYYRSTFELPLPDTGELLEWQFFNRGKSFPKGNEVKGMEDLIDLLKNSSLNVVVADAGYGKSYLLKKLSQYLNVAVYEELRNIDLPQLNQQLNKTYHEDQFIILDALDEVPHEDIPKVIYTIKRLITHNKNLKIILSCRDYIFEKYADNLIVNKIRYYQVEPFDYWQVKKYLESTGLMEDQITQTLKRFSNLFEVNTINSPRILQVYSELAVNDFEGTINKTKADLLDTFIYQRLKSESDKKYTSSQHLIKRVSEKIALLMQMRLNTYLPEDDFYSILDDTKGNLSQTFLQQVSLEEFHNRYILRRNATNNSYYFENVEWREYLAAKEISRLGRVDQVLFDLAFDTTLQEFYPDWKKCVGFLIQINPKLIPLIVDFIYRRSSVHDYNIIEEITDTAPQIGLTLNKSEKRDIFKKILLYFLAVDLWPDKALKNLIYLYEADFEEILQQSITELTKSHNSHKIRQRSNVLYLVIELIKKENQIHYSFWSKVAYEIICTGEGKQDVLDSIGLIGWLKDIKLLNKIYNPKKHDNRSGYFYSVTRAFITAIPNRKLTIELIIKGHARNLFNHIPSPDFSKINSAQGVKNVFKIFNETEDDDYLSLLAYRGRELFNAHFLEKLKLFYNDSIKQELLLILQKVNVYIYSRHNLKEILGVIKEVDGEFIVEWCNSIDEENRRFYAYGVLESLADISNINKIIRIVKNWEDGNHILFSLLQNFTQSGNEEGKLMADIILSHIDDFPTQRDVEMNTNSEFTEFDQNLISNFIEEVNTKDTNAIHLFYSNQEILAKNLGKHTKDFKQLVVHVLEEGNIENTVFPIALSLTEELNIKISSRIRASVARFISLYGNKDLFEEVANYISDPTEDEITILLGPHLNPLDTSIEFLNFYAFEFIYQQFKKEINTKTANKILKAFVLNDSIHDYHRAKALNLLLKDFDEIEFCFALFQKFKDTSNSLKQLAEVANAYLITKSSVHQTTSIVWRINEVKNRIHDFTNVQLVWPQDHQNIETAQPGLSNPLTKVSDKQYLNIYLDLLKFSLKEFEKDERNFPYADYIWNIVKAYFSNLKYNGSVLFFQEFEKTILNTCKEAPHYRLLIYKNQLKEEYLKLIRAFPTYVDCIKKFNCYKEKQHIAIATSEELFQLLLEVIDKELKDAMEIEKYISINKGVSGSVETMISKVVKPLFENYLMKRGLRTTDLIITREEQTNDDKQTDYMIRYGFCGQVFLELKRTDNPEVKNNKKRNQYKEKMLDYLTTTRSNYGIYLLLQVDKDNDLDTYLKVHEKLYSDCSHQIRVKGLRCIESRID